VAAMLILSMKYLDVCEYCENRNLTNKLLHSNLMVRERRVHHIEG
jgi:hypothetical protein